MSQPPSGGFFRLQPIEEAILMSHAFHQLYYHFIWTTHSRESLIERLWRIKGAASYRVNHELRPRFKLRWQEGYGVLTLRRDEVQQVGRYIDEQEEHQDGACVDECMVHHQSQTVALG